MIGYIRRQKDDNNKILRPLGFESQNHIAIKNRRKDGFFMASAAGLDPTAPGLGNLCSILMSYGDTPQFL